MGPDIVAIVAVGHDLGRPRALVLAELPERALARLREIADVVEESEGVARPVRGFSGEDLADLIVASESTILVVAGDEVTAPVLDLPLTVVACVGTAAGVDLRLAERRGIPVLWAPERDADAVAELTIGLLFAVTRHIAAADREIRSGEVFRGGVAPGHRLRGRRMAGCTFGIVGLGRVGRAVRWRAEGLGMRVIATDPFVPEATHDLRDLLREADVVSVHVPVTEETRTFIGPSEFSLMKRGAVYLNTSTAAVNDLTALVDALRWGHLGGAGLDHFEREWLEPGHPITRLRNVVLTPHLGEATDETELSQAELLVDDIARLLRGETPIYARWPAMG
ncbi:D-3-phosphoglycerate dehydrogenase SerA [Planotetraspora phitsanulokensis]|uniref:D-3-phosphoglycerate dehydrogenase n=1 Tax=Planotetraspora phitsanulokensis TaxID=575192 RepID=A0A8J3XFR8_9ACTN|nr:D-3-phosphoglycerate dehydrogenase [Planotetraspora phitsanulokensis]